MANLILRSALLFSLLTSAVFAEDSGPSCDSNNQCPEDTPCCSQYHKCGVGAYCLGGCDPVGSFSLDACVPQPVCKDYKKASFDNLDDFIDQTKYLGDPDDAPWVYSGEPVTSNGELWLTMAEDTVGTLIKSTTFMWYGRIKADIKVSPGAGVVTAFILLGDSKDEIDYEFIGVQQVSAQTNFYSQGVTDYTNGKNITGRPNIVDNFATYEIDWQPDSITWSIDGKVVRTLEREDTWNATAGRYSYPQSPCQVQLSLWPAGLASNGEGTIEWGGGLVDWSSDEMTNGYYHADFKNLEVECYDPPKGVNKTGDKSYVFTSREMTNNTVSITDLDTVLGSFQATGLNMDVGKDDQDSKNDTKNSIPGMSGGGPSDTNHGDDGDSTSSDSGDSSGTTTEGSASTGFVQGSGDSNAGTGSTEQMMQGSLFAALVAIVGLCVL